MLKKKEIEAWSETTDDTGLNNNGQIEVKTKNEDAKGSTTGDINSGKSPQI